MHIDSETRRDISDCEFQGRIVAGVVRRMREIAGDVVPENSAATVPEIQSRLSASLRLLADHVDAAKSGDALCLLTMLIDQFKESIEKD